MRTRWEAIFTDRRYDYDAGSNFNSARQFRQTRDGVAVSVYTLTNKSGVTARITNYGGIAVSLMAPDRNRKMADVVLGFDSLDGYLQNPGPFFGALIGRYGNRIGHARFTLEGRV